MLGRGALVSRAQRSTKWCAADPGPFQSVAVPDQRCTAPLCFALHRVRDTRWRRTVAARAGWSDPCIFLFFSRFGLFHPPVSPSQAHTPSRSRGTFCARGLQLCFTHPERGVGGAPRNVRVLSGTPVRRIMTRYARRLRAALRPITRDARLSALHRGGFGLPGPRFRLLGRPPSYNGGQLPCGSVQRAPRTQVVVPGGRGPCLPGRTVTSRRRGTPRLAPHSGSSLEHALNERGWRSYSSASNRSQ